MGCPHSGIDVVNSINLGKKLLLPIPAAKVSSGLLNTVSETTKWGIPATHNLEAYNNSFEMYNFGLGLLLLKILCVCVYVLMCPSTEPPYHPSCYLYNIFIHVYNVYNQIGLVSRIIYHRDLDTDNSPHRQRLRAYHTLVELMNWGV